MNKKIYIDPRWEKAGGIGTFYKNINNINQYEHIDIKGQPFNATDCWHSTKAIFKINDALFFFQDIYHHYIQKSHLFLQYMISII